MAKPIIAIDIDDVLANSTEALRLEVNQRLNVSIPASDYLVPGDYDNYYETVWLKHNLDITMDELVPQMQTDQAHIEPQAKAFQVLKHLAEQYQLIVVTSRDHTWQTATKAWIEQYFPNIFRTIVFSKSSANSKPLSKGEMCVACNASWLVDDNVEHAQSAESVGVKVILFGEYGWQHRAPKNMVRCRDWAAVKDYFDKQ